MKEKQICEHSLLHLLSIQSDHSEMCVMFQSFDEVNRINDFQFSKDITKI